MHACVISVLIFSLQCDVEMASTRSRRGVRVRSPNLSDVEDGGGSDSDYSPGSLMIDMGAEGKWWVGLRTLYIQMYTYMYWSLVCFVVRYTGQV